VVGGRSRVVVRLKWWWKVLVVTWPHRRAAIGVSHAAATGVSRGAQSRHLLGRFRLSLVVSCLRDIPRDQSLSCRSVQNHSKSDMKDIS